MARQETARTNSSALLLAAWGVALALLIIGQAAATFLLPRGFLLTLDTDLITLLVIVSAAAIFLRNAFASAGRIRIFWFLLASCWIIRIIAHTLWAYFDIVLRQEAPNPFVGDVLFFVSNIPVLAALLVMTQDESVGWRRSQATVDFSLLLLWWLYLYLLFVIPWQYVVLDVAAYGPNYNRLNGLVDVVLLGALAVLWRNASGRWKWVYATFLFAEVFISISGYLDNRAIDQQVYYAGCIYDIPYTAALASFTALGIVGASPKARDRSLKRHRKSLPLTKLGTIALLSLPFFTGWAVLHSNPPLPVLHFRIVVLLVATFAISALVLMRQSQLTADLAKAASVLEEASMTDPLTGVRNRRFFETTLVSDASRVLRAYAASNDDSPRDLIFYVIDLDSFKEVNDRYGHSIGDKLLVDVTRRITAVTRRSDILVRWGGDEFLILARDTDRREAEAFASRILNAVNGPDGSFLIDGYNIAQTCSIGWAAFPWRPDDPERVPVEAVLALADRAVYEAKAAGKNRAVGVRPSEGDDSDKFIATAGNPPLSYPVEILSVTGSPVHLM